MKIVVIDGQGGKVGKTIIEQLKMKNSKAEIYGIGTNSIATSAMLKAGAHYVATGENPVLVNVRDADVVVGPIGIVIADSLLGEITPKMASAVGASYAQKVLLPINKCKTHIIGVVNTTVTDLVAMAIKEIESFIDEG